MRSRPDDAIRTVKLFEFYVRNVWPVHRLAVRRKLSRRCSRCIASEKMVPLGDRGVCELCSRASAANGAPTRCGDEPAAQDLHGILRGAQGAGTGKYDALILFSGGKDSTYLVRRIRDDYPGLRVLAFTIHNGFMSPVALENVEDLVCRLAVDHIFVRPRRSFYVKLFRYCITHLNEQGGYGTVDFSDGEYLLDTARTIAAEKGIPLILAGYSRYQVQNGLKLDHFESPREKELANRTETAGISLRDIFSEEEIRMWWHGADRRPEDVARLLFPFHAWDLEEDEIKKQVTDWGLLSRKSASPIVTNHQLIPLLGVVDVHRFGYSSFEMEFRRMIREGKAERDEWQHVFEFLEYTAKTGLFMKPMIVDLLAQLDLTTDDVGVRFQ
jgi:hypothetical protein